MREKLGEILVRQGRVTQQQVNEALSHQKDTRKRFGETLMQLGYTTEERIYAALAEQWQLEFVPADQIMQADKDVLQYVPEVFAREHLAVPIGYSNSSIVVAMADPDDLELTDSLH